MHTLFGIGFLLCAVSFYINTIKRERLASRVRVLEKLNEIDGRIIAQDRERAVDGRIIARERARRLLKDALVAGRRARRRARNS
jgi:hypothetical protein